MACSSLWLRRRGAWLQRALSDAEIKRTSALVIDAFFCWEQQIREKLDFTVVSRSEQAQRSRSAEWQIPFYLATQWSHMAWPWCSFILAKLLNGYRRHHQKTSVDFFLLYSLSSLLENKIILILTVDCNKEKNLQFPVLLEFTLLFCFIAGVSPHWIQ